MNLYSHQQKIINDDPKKSLIAIGTGGGKTRICLELAEGSTLVICPKQQREDHTWQLNAAKFGIIINLTVISKEDFRRDWDDLPPFDTIIGDECHNLLGVLPETKQVDRKRVPKTSQLYENLRKYIEKHPPKRLYLASATPVTKPMHLWAIATLFGKKWDFNAFRERFYFERVMGMRRIWLPLKDKATKEYLAGLVKSFGYTGTLSDFFDVPEQTHKTVFFDLTSDQKEAIDMIEESEADPLAKRSRYRTIENGVLYNKKVEEVTATVDKLVDDVEIFPSEKIDYILERAEEFPKLLIFATYTAQVNEIARVLKAEGFDAVTLTGKTKNRATLIKEADASDAKIVISNCAISEGYELPSFPCVIYASKSYRYVHYEQSLGRVLRANALKKNLYIHLVVRGGTDEDCHNAIMSGVDFQEMVMASEENELSPVTPTPTL